MRDVLAVLDTLGEVAQLMDPRRLDKLIAMLDGAEEPLAEADTRFADVVTFARRAISGLREAPHSDNPAMEAYGAIRQYSRALEAVCRLELEQDVAPWLLEPKFRADPAVIARLADPPRPDTGAFHAGNDTTERGGFSVYVPPWYDRERPHPVVFALHGGSGHGRLFLWNWVPEARGRDLIVVAPTAIGDTWSLMNPEVDGGNLDRILRRVRDRWNVDPGRILLSGMSDGGTFTLLSGLGTDSPFTHLAPVAASFHPLMISMADPERLTGLPIHLTHGALDWMFPVDRGRLAARSLQAAGARVVYREIPDLSHAYPRDGQGEVVDWFQSEQAGA